MIEDQWRVFEPLLPVSGAKGRPRVDVRRVINGIDIVRFPRIVGGRITSFRLERGDGSWLRTRRVISSRASFG
ncbi:hypothetical protein ACH47G_33710, partial [Nocardia beijingensis]